MIQYVEGDTALTPDQGRTSGSNGIQRGGMQIRQAAATAREALIELAAPRLNMKADDLVANDGQVRPKSGGAGVRFADLIGGRNFSIKLDPKAPLKNPPSYTLVGKPFLDQTFPPNAQAVSPMYTILACLECCMRASSVRRQSAPS
jgi:nicotinate dehydrogenase subunit B